MNFYYHPDKKIIFKNGVEAYLHPDLFMYYFNDKEFINTDWTKEPSQSLSELYKLRAQKIREDYDYLILCYSGGYDSTNVLETFYYNDILIDEILFVGAFSQDSHVGSDENHNGEIYLNAYPTLKKLNLQNTKITEIDYTKHFNDINNFTLIKNYSTNWPEHIGFFYSVNNFFWHDLELLVPHNKDKKTGVIFGIEKPHFQFDESNNKTYTKFSANMIEQYGNFQGNEHFKRINFYTDIDTIDLMKKQLHIINKFFIDNCLVKNTMASWFFFNNYNAIVNKLIYNLKNPLTFKSPKTMSNIMSLRDNFILNDKNSDMYKIYKEGLKNPSVFKFIRPPVGFSGEGFGTRSYYIS